MESVAVQYLGGSDEVYVPAAGVTAYRGDPAAGEPGPPVEVPADVAGREPHWRPVRPGDDLTWLASRTVELTWLDDEGRPVEMVEVLDPGSGLLAQEQTWRRAPVTQPVDGPAGEEG